MVFNIYYINFPKVYEIKMMLGNVIPLNKELENSGNSDASTELGAKIDFGSKLLNLFKIEGEGKVRVAGSSVQKVIETFEVKTTKSVILNEVIKNAKPIENFTSIKEGELIRIDNISLSLENEPELRLVKLFTSNAFKDMNVPGTNGVDMNNIFNSLFKDYAYKIKGKNLNNQESILVKIPLTFESEFESSYSVDDLFIGKVTIIGLYKGKIKLSELRNSLEFFQEIGNLKQPLNVNQKEDDEIQTSQHETIINEGTYNPFLSSLQDNKEYHYIDILSIIQVINTQEKNGL